MEVFQIVLIFSVGAMFGYITGFYFGVMACKKKFILALERQGLRPKDKN